MATLTRLNSSLNKIIAYIYNHIQKIYLNIAISLRIILIVQVIVAFTEINLSKLKLVKIH